MTGSSVVRQPSPDRVATTVAHDVAALLREAQQGGGAARLVLTGGWISRKVHAALAGSVEPPDWRRVDVWWGDDRYVAGDDEERNAGQAWQDLLSRVPVDPERVHAMPAADDDYLDAEAAAWAHGEELARTMAGLPPGEPWFDVLMLGIGTDGHCASLFPGRSEVASDAVVLAVRDAPKPPPTRISMGMGTLAHARHVVFVATGADKAGPVARSVAGADVTGTPSAGPRGTESTTWYVNDAAAARL